MSDNHQGCIRRDLAILRELKAVSVPQAATLNNSLVATFVTLNLNSPARIGDLLMMRLLLCAGLSWIATEPG